MTRLGQVVRLIAILIGGDDPPGEPEDNPDEKSQKPKKYTPCGGEVLHFMCKCSVCCYLL